MARRDIRFLYTLAIRLYLFTPTRGLDGRSRSSYTHQHYTTPAWIRRPFDLCSLLIYTVKVASPWEKRRDAPMSNCEQTMLSGRPSNAIHFVRPKMACLDMVYGAEKTRGT